MIASNNYAVHSADVVIIGGGVIGCAIAYYLSQQAVGRVLLIERQLIAEGNTTRAAALLTRARVKTCLMPLIRETYQVIEELEDQLGEKLGLRQVGSLHVATSPATKYELNELVEIAQAAGLSAYWVAAQDAEAMAPWLTLDHEAWAAYMPEDAFIDPYVLTHAFARAAQHNGAIIWQTTAVTEILRLGQQIVGVNTALGFVASPIVIDAAGVWAGLLAQQIGCALPMAPVRSHYWITTSQNGLFHREQPIVILPDAKAYTRPEGTGLLFGLREEHVVSVDPRTLPEDMNQLILNDDRKGWGTLIDGAPALLPFFPALERLEIAHYIVGLSTYTPDGLFVLGGLPGLKGFLAATGCSGLGIAASGGIGLALAQLATDQPVSFDLTPYGIDRFGPIDPLSEGFRWRCAYTRSKKTSG
jgi:4-methylaminobutanoate oxidase (formaldehyde-forming)